MEALNEESLRRDEESRSSERKVEEERLRLILEAESAAKQRLTQLVLRERFGVVLIGVGFAFAILLTFLPAAPSKPMLYGCALVCALLGARQRDQARREIAVVLLEISAEELRRFRALKW